MLRGHYEVMTVLNVLLPPRWPCGKASASRAADLGLIPAFTVDHTSDLKTGTPGAVMLGAWHCRVSAGTGWSGLSAL